jgi:hypothetical protein
MREFEIILFQTQSLSIKPKERQFSFNILKEHFKAFCEAFAVEFYLKLKLILRIITYLTYICLEIDNFVIKTDIFRGFFICKNILTRKYMHAETLALLTKPLYFPNMKYQK